MPSTLVLILGAVAALCLWPSASVALGVDVQLRVPTAARIDVNTQGTDVGCECAGPGAELYDHGVDYSIADLVTTTLVGRQALCPGGSSYGYDVAQLFTPPRVPWKLTRVCFALRLAPLANVSVPLQATVAGDVSLYPVSVTSGRMLPGDRVAVAAFKRTIAHRPPAPGAPKSLSSGVVPVWLSVDVSGNDGMVVWDKGAFVGINFWSCARVQAVGVWMPRSMRRTSGWYCDKSKYNDGKCDCNCGAGDVDCNINPANASGCRPGSVCDQSGHCVALDWGKLGVCSASNYWQYDGCQCECGSVIDPDCLDRTAPITQCSATATGPLVYPFCNTSQRRVRPACTEQWLCDPKLYNDGKVCNCGCGVADPDCDNYSLNTDCPGNAICFANQCSVPRAWTCPPQWYGNSDDCDCGCGAYDPDCDSERLGVHNCSAGQSCQC
eukprot:m51a1_g7244 hypothetical protein (438) ;mRNA; r:117720-120514